MNQTYTGKLNWQKRYAAAHFEHQSKLYPTLIKDGLYCLPKYPIVTTTNGITAYIINFINWNGWLAERVGVEGRMIKKKGFKSVDGRASEDKFVRIQTSGMKGSTDLHITVNGYSIKGEIKNENTKDRMSEKQKAYAHRAKKAGALHFIWVSVDSFLNDWDNIIYKLSKRNYF